MVGCNIDDRAYDINFQDLREDARYGTIEYRQHAGTIDTEAVLHRVRLVVALTSWAVKGDNLAHLLWASEKQNFGGEMNILRLMRLLSIDDDVILYYSDRLHTHREMPVRVDSDS